MTYSRSGHRSPKTRQAGVVLFVALIALVAITLAAVALVRSMDTGLVIAGNTAFKRATTAAADVATEGATTWLAANNDAVTLSAPHVAVGYYANWKDGCDMTGNRTPTDTNDDIGWTAALANTCATTAVAAAGMPAGYTASYVVMRMCACDGATTGVCPSGVDNTCAGIAGRRIGHETGEVLQRLLNKDDLSRIPAQSPYYRIVARVVGPRNTTSFVETVVTLN
jgi:type IV pilus assembly protein PilX